MNKEVRTARVSVDITPVQTASLCQKMAQPLAELPAHGQRVQVQTEYTGITDKPSTRLHAPPGGHQSINIFGGEDYPAVPARLKPTPAQTEAPARAVAPAQPTNTGMAASGRIQVNTEHTGISDRSSTRLHAPPGGKQSINIFAQEVVAGSAEDRMAAMKARRQERPY